ncbi:hypothetical protein CR513_13193, partial [Mucuna pruriens]
MMLFWMKIGSKPRRKNWISFRKMMFRNQSLYAKTSSLLEQNEFLETNLMKMNSKSNKLRMESTYQTKYVKKLLKKFNLEDCKSMTTPSHSTFILTLDDLDKKVDQTSYKDIIDSLLYLTASRSDIMFSICLCARFKRTLENQISVQLNVLLILKSNEYMFKGHNDVDYVGDKIERRNANGACHFIRANLQETRNYFPIDSKSRIYYRANINLRCKHRLEDYNIFESNIPLLCDNTTTINLSKNLILHYRAKHIEIKHHLIRYYVSWILMAHQDKASLKVLQELTNAKFEKISVILHYMFDRKMVMEDIEIWKMMHEALNILKYFPK